MKGPISGRSPQLGIEDVYILFMRHSHLATVEDEIVDSIIRDGHSQRALEVVCTRKRGYRFLDMRDEDAGEIGKASGRERG